jgi:hypothetical protein
MTGRCPGTYITYEFNCSLTLSNHIAAIKISIRLKLEAVAMVINPWNVKNRKWLKQLHTIYIWKRTRQLKQYFSADSENWISDINWESLETRWSVLFFIKSTLADFATFGYSLLKATTHMITVLSVNIWNSMQYVFTSLHYEDQILVHF